MQNIAFSCVLLGVLVHFRLFYFIFRFLKCIIELQTDLGWKGPSPHLFLASATDRIPSTRSSYPQPHPACPWALPGMGQSEFLPYTQSKSLFFQSTSGCPLSCHSFLWAPFIYWKAAERSPWSLLQVEQSSFPQPLFISHWTTDLILWFKMAENVFLLFFQWGQHGNIDFFKA